MEFDEAFMAYLLAQSALTALVGNRVYYDDEPQNSDLPCVVIIYVSDVLLHTMDGQSETEQPMIQLTAKAETRKQARAVSKQIEAALCDYVGTMSGLTVQYITLENRLPGKEVSSDGLREVHLVDLEFQIIFNKE